jgi:hypothetical protein
MTRNQSKSNFIELIRSDLSNTIDAILNHPYFRIQKEDDLVKWVEQFIISYTKCNGGKRYSILGITDHLRCA